jgi:D-3-phosphoglycerate dehydrogenase
MKILIIDEMHPSLIDMLNADGWEYEYAPLLKRAEILEVVKDYEGLIVRSKTVVDSEFLEKAPKLKFIARAGAGLDLIDIPLVEARGIALFHAGTGNRDAVGEHVLGMLLGLFINLLKADREVRQGVWDREGNRGIELMGKTVGLIGYGNNGSATGKRLSGFGCKVLAYDKYKQGYGDANAFESTIEEIQQEADIVSLHIPLTQESYHLIDQTFIEGMAKPFFLVNAARGEVADLKAVVEGLKSGKIRGACLDVLENEKLAKLTPDQQEVFAYLTQSDRVVLTPHVGGWTHESYVRINEVLCRQIREWRQVALPSL